MPRTVRWVLAGLLLAAAPAWAAEEKYAVKVATTEPPKELTDAVRQTLSNQALQVLDDKGSVLAEVWLRQEVPVKATPEQIKNGLTYQEVPEGTLLGAVRFEQQFTDYRKQKIKPGVYTLRFAFQPQDGDHMGTAPHPEFALLVPAHRDAKPDAIEAKHLHEQSARATTGSHPGILLLFPNEKPQDMPAVVEKSMGHQVLQVKAAANAGGQKAALGLALTVVGHTSAE